MSNTDSVDAIIASKVAERNERIMRNERVLLVAEKYTREACEKMGLRIESSTSDPDYYCEGSVWIHIFVPCKCAGKRYVLFGERGFVVKLHGNINESGKETYTSSVSDSEYCWAAYKTAFPEKIGDVIGRSVNHEIARMVNGKSWRSLWGNAVSIDREISSDSH